MENIKEDLYTKFVNAIQADINGSIQDAEDIAVDFAIDFSEITSVDQSEEGQREIWDNMADEFMLDVNVQDMADRYGQELFKAIIKQGEIFLQ